MASRVSSLSDTTSVSSIERRTVDSEGLLHTSVTAVSTNEAEQPRGDQGVAADEVSETDPPIRLRNSSQGGEQIAEADTKDPVGTHRMQHDRRSLYHDRWF